MKPSVVVVARGAERTTLMRSEVFSLRSLVPVSLDELVDPARYPAELVHETVAAGYVAADGPTASEAAARLQVTAAMPVVTRAMAQAVGLAFGALTYLRSVRRQAMSTRTLVVGAEAGATLTPLLFLCGLTDVALWNVEDERWLPLRTAIRDADVVIDLAEATDRMDVRDDCADGSIIAATRFDPDATIAPGLLAGIADAGARRDELDNQLLRECVSVLLQAGAGLGWPQTLVAAGIADSLRIAVGDFLRVRRLEQSLPRP